MPYVIECEICGNTYEIESMVNFTIRVKPCKHCLHVAKQEGYDTARTELVETKQLISTDALIKARILDFEALQALDIKCIKAYLVSRGWTRVGDYKVSSIYTLIKPEQKLEPESNTITKHNIPEVVVPNSNNVNVRNRIANAISIIALVENRSELSVYYDIIAMK